MKQRRLFAALLWQHSLPWRSRGLGRQGRRRRPWKTPLDRADGSRRSTRSRRPGWQRHGDHNRQPRREEVCWEINAAGIVLPAAAAHIHVGATGVAGPVVVTLSAPDASGSSSSCTTVGVDRDLAKAILKNQDYYVNVHASEFRTGDRGSSPSSLTAYQYTVGPGHDAPAFLMTFIHPSAWGGILRTSPLGEFSEVPHSPVPMRQDSYVE